MKQIIALIGIVFIISACTCPSGSYWNPKDHCNAVCHSQGLSIDKDGHNQAKEVIEDSRFFRKGQWVSYTCVCDKGNVTVSRTCI